MSSCKVVICYVTIANSMWGHIFIGTSNKNVTQINYLQNMTQFFLLLLHMWCMIQYRILCGYDLGIDHLIYESFVQGFELYLQFIKINFYWCHKPITLELRDFSMFVIYRR